MKFGLDRHTKKRIEPAPGLYANCPCCEAELIPKCGNIKIHHWAHKSRTDCDHWWEPETEWHRKWKNRFPSDWQETIKVDQQSGEKHIADVYNPNIGLVIEFQNSPIDFEELASREKFYRKMLWLVNAETFTFSTSSLDEWNEDVGRLENKIKRDASKTIKKPSYDLFEQNFEYEMELRRIGKAADYGQIGHEEWQRRKLLAESKMFMNEVAFYADQKNLEAMELRKYHEQIEKFQEENKTKAFDDQFIQYTWLRRRKVWAQAALPIFFDLGNELIFIRSPFIARRVTLDKFLGKYGGII